MNLQKAIERFRSLRFSDKFSTKSLDARELLNKWLFLILIIPLILIAVPLMKPGLSGSGDFPYPDTPDYAAKKLWLWRDADSTSNFESLQRYPVIGLSFLLHQIGVTSDSFSKVMVISGFAAASYSFYFSFIRLYKTIGTTRLCLLLKVAAIVGSLFYAYNAWSFYRISHWYLWMGYAVLPLFFIFAVYAFVSTNKWKNYSITAVFIWSFASMTPHMAVFFPIVFVALFVYFSLNVKLNRKKLLHYLKVSTLIGLSYLGISLFWILPYLLSSLNSSSAIAPTYVVSEDVTQMLSRDSNIVNVVRLIENWLPTYIAPHAVPPQDSSFYYLWESASFVMPALAFSTLLLVRHKQRLKHVILLSGFALAAIYLTMGTKAPFNLYAQLLFSAGLLTKFNWLFRDPDKWAFAIAFCFSILIALATIIILQKLGYASRRYGKLMIGSFIAIILFCQTVYSYPVYNDAMGKVYNPVQLPTAFNQLNTYLSQTKTEKIYFMPYPTFNTQWSQDHRLGGLYQMYSLVPSIGTRNLEQKNYYTFLQSQIIHNETKTLSNFLNPLGTKYVVFHNDTLSPDDPLGHAFDTQHLQLLSGINSLADMKNVTSAGFFKIFATKGVDGNITEVNIPKKNYVIVGGLDKFTSLNSIDGFDSQNSSLLFLDQGDQIKNVNNILENSTGYYYILGKNSLQDLMLNSIKNGSSYFISPFDATNRHEPSETWSKIGSMDPTNGAYHNQLAKFNIENWDFDYGNGMVMTWAGNQSLSIPFETKSNNSDNYAIYIRYLQNERGGEMNISIDGKFIEGINSKAQSNEMVWADIGNLKLTKGTHILTLKNVFGLNVVNVFAAIPTSSLGSLTDNAKYFANQTKNIYLLEGEHDFHDAGKNIGSFPLFGSSDIIGSTGSNQSKSNYNNNNNNGALLNHTYSGQFSVPPGVNLVSLQLSARHLIGTQMSYAIKKIEIARPANSKVVFTDNFEEAGALQRWRNYTSNVVISVQQDNSTNVSGIGINNTSNSENNHYLKVDVKQGDNPLWNIVSTEFIPVDNQGYYRYSFDASAKDVKELHAKVYYFDSRERSLGTDFISQGTSGTFTERYTNTLLPPVGTKYIKLQTWALQNPQKDGGYSIDNVTIEQINPAEKINEESLQFDNESAGSQKMINGASDTTLPLSAKGNSSINNNFIITNTIVTKPFEVEPGFTYNYNVTVEATTAGGMHSLNASVIFKIPGAQKSPQAIASGGHILDLKAKSEVFADLNVLKSSNYTIALRVNTCPSCTFLKVISGNNNDTIANFSLKDSTQQLKWLYADTYLKQGQNELKLYSDSSTSLDLAIVYSTDKLNEKLSDIFAPTEAPAHIVQYKEINPTKTIVKINSTKPYILTFAQSYDPLWRVYIGNSEVKSIPVYSIINGFYIDKVGQNTITIEYAPQKWFEIGGSISAASVTILVAYLLGLHRKIKSIKSLHLA